MLATLAAAGLTAVLAVGLQTDTTVTVRPGARLEVENFGGTIAVSAWDRNAVRVEATHSRRTRTELERSDEVLSVRAVGRMGTPGAVDYRIRVPRWMELRLSGLYTDMTLEGVQGAVSAETVKGEVRLEGGRGHIKLSSIEGNVDVTRASGRLEASSVNESVRIVDFEGDLTAETVNGDIRLERIASGAIEGATVNGDIRFDGPMRKGGRYQFATHNGDLVMVLPRNPNVAVSVSTFSGDFDSTFPIELRNTRRGRRFDFTLGRPDAELELESFQGSILLRRVGDPMPRLETPRTPRTPGVAPVPRVKVKTPKPPRAPDPTPEPDDEE